MNDDLLHDIKGLLRQSIATTLKIPKSHYETSMVAQTSVNRCLTMIMAIGYNETVEGALDDLCEFGAIGNLNEISREQIYKEIRACLNTFRSEIASFEKMHVMNQEKKPPMEIWNAIVSEVSLADDFHDDWFKQTHMKYQKNYEKC